MVKGLIQIRAAVRDTDPILVFVHGILSSTAACWRNRNGRTWPGIVIEDPQFPSCGVYTFEYASSVSDSRVSISSAADSMWSYLQDADLITPGRLLVFVCHSMGGIVTRRLIVTRQGALRRGGVSPIGLFLVASPTMGSRWAKWFLPLVTLLKHGQAIALSPLESNDWLHDLRHDFLNLRGDGDIQVHGKELVESRPIGSKWLSPILPPIVSPLEGAVTFSDHLTIAGTNHFTIAKPMHDRAEQHLALRNFVKDFVRRSSGGNYKVPSGTNFSTAAMLIAKARGWDIDLSMFTSAEMEMTSATERLVTGATTEEALKNLALAFPAGSIRRYHVTIQHATAILSPY